MKTIGQITAEIANMSSEEVSAFIDPEKLKTIKAVDPHPEFRAYQIAHDGTSSSTIKAAGKAFKSILTWVKSAVRKVHDNIQLGTPLFWKHAQTNDHSGRTQLGEVVGRKLVEMQNMAKAIIATYIYPQFRQLDADVISYEGEFGIPDDGVVTDAHVGAVTGIALGSRAQGDKPAFPGAGLEAIIQMFAEQNIQKDDGGQQDKDTLSPDKNKEKSKMEITLKDVKAYIKAEGLSATDLFQVTEILEDEVLKKRTQKEIDAGVNAVKKELEELKKKNETLTAEKGKIEATNSQLNLTINKATSLTKLGEVIAERNKDGKLPEAQVKYITSQFPKRLQTPEKEGDIDSAVNTLIDELMKEAAEYFPGEKGGDGNDKGGGGAPPSDKDGSGNQGGQEGINGPYSTPETNPLLAE